MPQGRFTADWFCRWFCRNAANRACHRPRIPRQKSFVAPSTLCGIRRGRGFDAPWREPKTNQNLSQLICEILIDVGYGRRPMHGVSPEEEVLSIARCHEVLPRNALTEVVALRDAIVRFAEFAVAEAFRAVRKRIGSRWAGWSRRPVDDDPDLFNDRDGNAAVIVVCHRTSVLRRGVIGARWVQRSVQMSTGSEG